uniref:MADF domain-containing protein n=1 Tax=Clytia hemisphaerica TaxID=252671 RepID=A0A7M5WWF9_9CNID|eukprot:TCONS_00049830-protein
MSDINNSVTNNITPKDEHMIVIIDPCDDEVTDNPDMFPENGEESRKLNDEEKRTLINFYKENPILWERLPYQKSKTEKAALRQKMVDLFDGQHTAEVLERAFLILRTSMLREVKLSRSGINQWQRKWRFYDDMLFLKDVLLKGKKRHSDFEEQDLLRMIEFYRENNILLNRNPIGIELHVELLNRLATDLDDRFTVRQIKSRFEGLVDRYRQEKLWINKFQGYNPSWSFYECMYELDEQCNFPSILDDPPTKKQRVSQPPNIEKSRPEHQRKTPQNSNTPPPSEESTSHSSKKPFRLAGVTLGGSKKPITNTLQDNENALEPPHKIAALDVTPSFVVSKSYQNLETVPGTLSSEDSVEYVQTREQSPSNDVRIIDSYSTKDSISNAGTPNHSLNQPALKVPVNNYQSLATGTTLSDKHREESAQRFGLVVADSLLQCEMSDWPRLKKKIMDLFYDYEENKCLS